MTQLVPDRKNKPHIDIIIVGAGLAGLCLAYRLQTAHPNLTLAIFDEVMSLEGSRTWSFHHDDVQDLVPWQQFVSHSWKCYEVQFSFRRLFSKPYYTISSQCFFARMQDLMADSLNLGVKIESLGAHHVITAKGEKIQANVVFDARPDQTYSEKKMVDMGWGFQKFLGLELMTEVPHGLTHPILMDAKVPQQDGFRFIYLLPLSATEILIEDTHYSNSADIDIEKYRAEILKYALDKGWKIKAEQRSEQGVLPIPTGQVCPELKGASIVDQPLRIGTGAGFYHPVTGYSFLWSATVANRLAQIVVPTRENYAKALAVLQSERRKNEKFYLLLNKLLFYASRTENRKNIFQRFYKMPEDTISRFYSSQTSFLDKCRILIGRPPISIVAAMKALLISKRGPNASL